MRRTFVVLALLFSVPAFAGESENLVVLARVWAYAKYLDPAIESNDVDWDAAVIHAIPAARAAKSDDELARAIAGMLAELHDPATRVVKEEQHSAGVDVPLFRRLGDVLVVNAGPYIAAHGDTSAFAASQTLMAELLESKAVVVDLRTGGDEDVADAASSVLFNMPGATVDLPAPSGRYTFHSGYATQSGASTGGYYSGFITISGATLRASRAKAPERWVFVLDDSSRLNDSMLALRNGGKAAIVSSVQIGDTAAGVTRPVPIAGKWFALVRVTQLDTALTADVIDPDPLAAAMPFARGEKPIPSRDSATHLAEPGRWKPEATYAGDAYPDTEHRLLGAFRLWAVIHYFYPYLKLIGDWDAAFAKSIPQFIAAKDVAEYAKAAMAFDANVEDGHSNVYGRSVSQAIPVGFLPIDVHYIGNDLVVFDPMSVADLHKGDVIVSIDGEPIADRVARLRPYFTASTDRARADRVASVALRGTPNQPAILEVRDAKGMRSVTITRGAPPSRRESNDAAYRLLASDLGYADLQRLQVADVDAMFDAFANTKAIILDMRGYPRGTAWAIAPRINTKQAEFGAQFRRRQLTGFASSEEEAVSAFFFEQPLPKSEKPLYRGKVVVLIDDRAISQAEHSCLFFEAANGPTFIGSPTAGANGDVTSFPLPGDINVLFTGHDVRHADGRQLQRVGIQPDIHVEPTIEGLRAGRDEVLDRAIQFVNSGR